MATIPKIALLSALVLCLAIGSFSQTTNPSDTTAALSDTSNLKEVIVTGNRAPFQRQADKLIVNVAGNALFKSSANAWDILKKVPGVEVAGDGTLQLSGRVAPVVFIDGKPTPMSAEELQNYLSSLSAEMIASIEIINNPSSQYDAEYKGIINIKLKPDLSLGWKGILTSNLQRNEFTISESNLLLTYKTKKIAYTARLGYTSGYTVRTYKALQHLANTNIMETNTKIVTGNNNVNLQLGADYNINKDQRIEVLLRNYRVDRSINSYNTLNTMDADAKNQVSHTNSNNDAAPTQTNYAANLNYIAKFGKTQLQVLTSLVKIENRQQEDIQNKNTLNNQLQSYWKTGFRNDVLIRSAQADLAGLLANGKWSIGAKFVYTTTRNDLRYDTLTTSNNFEVDSNRTNSFYYDEYITAGYLNYERKLGKFNIIAGLRTEHTHSVADAITIKQVTSRDYLTWLPSLNIAYELGRNQQLNLAATRRITRPGFALLNPFRFYFSPLNYWVGNPYLLPSKTNMVNLSYSRKALTVSFNIGREIDPMTRYPEYDPVTNILEYLGKNLPYNDFAGLEISYPFTITKWWRMSNNLGLYYMKEQTPYHGVTYAIPIKSISFTGSQVFTLPKGFTFDVYYLYRHPGGNGLYFARAETNIDLGLQKAWFKGRLNSKFNFYDIFNTYRVQRIFREKTIIDNHLQHWFGMHRVALTLSYSFGSSTYKAKQAARNEEETRAGM